MITVTAGRTFLNAYNEKTKQTLSAKEFFEKEFLEIFYNHPKYLMTGGNSPLENPKISWKKGERPNAENRKERIKKTLQKIQSDAFDASVALGFPASEHDVFQPTSGLVTDIPNQYLVDDKYFSWIGAGLSIGVEGAFLILFDQPEILLKTFEGWKVYRQFLNDATLDRLSGNKITSWNGQWLNYVYSADYREDFNYGSLDNLGVFKHDKEETAIETIKWSVLFFNLSRKFSGRTFIGYVFSFGQMNKTLGFFPFIFNQARKLILFYEKLFGENAAIQDAKIYEEMFGKLIKDACKLGSFGLQSLEPEGIKEYFHNDKMPNLSIPSLRKEINETETEYNKKIEKNNNKYYETKIIPFQTFKTWLLAMITKNNEELSDYTQNVAKAIYEYREAYQKDKAGSTKVTNTINNLLASKSKRMFIEVLTEIISDKNFNETKIDILKILRDEVHLMNSEDFGYFVVLLKFDYAYQVRNS